MEQLTVYIPKITPRHTFVFGLILRDILDIEFTITDNSIEFSQHSGPKFSYGFDAVGDELFFAAVNLLSEMGIKPQNLDVFENNDYKAFYKVEKPLSALPFDVFSASFYLVSRYEEYLPHSTDEHLRFKHTDSIAFKHNFLLKPLVNIWALELKKILRKKFPELQFSDKRFSYLSTFDIDTAFAFKERNLFRTLGGYGKSLIKFDIKDIFDRTLVLLKIKKDPYDTFALQEDFCRKYNIAQLYFYLVGDYAPNDKNINLQKSKKLQKLIKYTQSFAAIGVHPSYTSNTYPAKVKTEMERIQSVIGRPITKSRQHFLKLNLPYTYQNLIQQGITEDYTLGFPTSIGFRASICTPFYFYDLKMDQETKLKLFPFQVMDGTLKDYMKLQPEEANILIAQMLQETKAVNGLFISLWHNHSLSEYREWKGWRKVYETMLQNL